MNKIARTGRRLLDALTEEQIESLLDAVGSDTLLEKVHMGVRKSDSDIADTVTAVLQSVDESKEPKCTKGRVASNARLLEDWGSLWRQWYDIVGDVGGEGGKYSVQEHHWEEPYFDGSAVANDLEKVGTAMYRQIDAVYDLVNDPDLFTGALEEIEEAINSYPEWMGADCGDGCTLENQTTRCVLKWLWLSCKDEAHPGAALLKEMENIEKEIGLVSLDKDATVDFVIGLPEPVCREVHAELHNGSFAEEQKNAHSQWNAIAHEFERRYDAGLYLERCGRNLDKNWREGEPLVRKSVKEKDWHGAESWLVKTFAAYRHWRTTAAWYPEQTLLVAEDHTCRVESDSVMAAGLLEQWGMVGEELGNRQRAVAARFQSAVVRDPVQLGRIVDKYKELRNENVAEPLDAVFRQWQDEMARRSIHYHDDARRFTDTWIHWAIVAQTEPDGVGAFRKRLDAWLNLLVQDAGEFEKQWRLLACLTDDLGDSSGYRARFPGLFKSAMERFGGKSSLDTSRAALVGSLCAPGTKETVMEVWRKRLAGIIPDPAMSSNDYRNPVAWMKALLELNPDAYSRVVKKWQTTHHRRRNLWRAMREARLPVGEG